MNNAKIINKLKSILKQDIYNECQVVYILSRLRILIEDDKSKNKELRFYCDWILHNELSFKNTTKMISDLFDDCIDISKSGKDIATEINKKHSDFFKLNNLKTELSHIFKKYDVPLNVIEENKKWNKFMLLFFQIIEDCPVICTESSTKIEKLKLVKDKKGNYSYKFNLKENKRSPIVKIKFK